MPSFEDTASIFERMTEMANVASGFNESFLNSISAMESIASESMNMELSITGYSNAAADVQNQLNGVIENVNEAQQVQNDYNESLTNFMNMASGVGNRIKSLAGSFGKIAGITSVQELFNMTDTYTMAAQEIERVFNVADSADITSGVMAAANSSGISFANMQENVLNLGQSGFGANEAVAFTELANKAYAVAGYSGADQQAVVSQLVNSMAAGDMQASIEALSISPEMYSALESYVADINTAGLSMEEMAAKGMIGMDTIQAAVFNASQGINNSFSQLPVTWQSVWNNLGNFALRALTPVFGVLSFLANNISIILPLVIGLGASFAVFKVAANWAKICTAKTAIFTAVTQTLGTVYKLLSGQITFAAAVQKAFNGTMLACPIAWIIVGIIAIIAVIFALVAVINKVTGSTLSVAGIIMGAVFTVGAFILNIIISIWNAFAVVADFFANVFKNPVASVEILFRSLAINVLEFISNMVKGIEDLINKIPGVEIDITSGVNNTLEKMRNDLANLKSEADWEDYTQTVDYVDYGKAFENGYNFGEGLGDSFKGLFSGNELEMPNPDDFNFGDYAGGIQDYTEGVQNYGGSSYGGAAYTGGMPSGMMSQAAGSEANMSQTSQKQLLRAAQGGSLAKTTAITINMNNENRINSDLDVDGVVDYLARATADAMAGMAEGV